MTDIDEDNLIEWYYMYYSTLRDHYELDEPGKPVFSSYELEKIDEELEKLYQTKKEILTKNAIAVIDNQH